MGVGMKVFHNRMLRRILRPNGVIEAGENYAMRSFTLFLHHILE